MCFYGTSGGACGRISISAAGKKKFSLDWKAGGDEETSGGVSSISCDSEGTLLFVARANGTVSRTGAKDGDQAESYSVEEGGDLVGVRVLSDDKYAYLSSGKEVLLYSFAKEKAIGTLLPSHDSRIVEIATCLDEKVLLGAGAGVVDVWKVNRRPAAKPASSACTINLPSGSEITACSVHKTEPLVALVTKSKETGHGLVYLYSVSMKTAKKGSNDESVLLATLECGSAEVVGSEFCQEGGKCIIALAASEDGEVSFHDVEFDTEESGKVINLGGGSAEGSPSTNKAGAKKRKQLDAEQPQQNGKDSGEEEEAGPSPHDSTPLEVRVSQMAINSGKKGAPPAGQNGASRGQAKGNQLNADSTVVLLSQALQSSDKQLLEQCLQIRQEQVISNTVKQLRSDQVGKLVPLLVERINSSSTRAMQVACWLRHLVRNHLTYIISAPTMKRHLSVLYQSLEERQSSHNALLGLHGRLELLTSYIKTMRQRQAEAAQNAADGSAQDYYSDPSVVHVHESDQVETISLVPQVPADLVMEEQSDEDSEEDEDMEEGSEEEED
mmetsp:Transcript_1373/g.3943  ORF Transcript_1373/g.3943 Transcript_1373/m.3943 type:complete len:554 (+) Transcript_1373:167-1828(+)